jgi:hypothetical protein
MNLCSGRKGGLLVSITCAAITGCGGGGSPDSGGGTGTGTATGTPVGTTTPTAATITNHAPTLAHIADQHNSAYTYETRIRPVIDDVDGDVLTLSVAVDDGRTVNAMVDGTSGEIVLQPLQRGRALVTVTLTDGRLSDSDSFSFEVGEVTKSAQAQAAPAAGDAITLLNTADQSAEFVLTHNGFRTFESVSDMLAYITAMPAEVAGEPFERKLWRFVRDNVYHWNFLNPNPWLMSPTVIINSLGFGMCSSVAATYVELARAAGYEARIWALTGHVVPEIRTANAWKMFDPDLAIYYRRQDSSIAGVEHLSSDRSLVSAPLDPLFPIDTFPGYSSAIADIYASQTDNFVWPSLIDLPDGLPGRISLPPGAKLTYPGRWTEPPVAYGDDNNPAEVPQFEQAAMNLAAGWTGTVTLPWIVWEIMGEGTVRLGDIVYAIGSDELRQRLRASDSAISKLELVQSSGSLTIIFLLNPLRYEIRASNQVELTGPNVWQVQVGVEQLPEQSRAGGPFPAELRKPVP